MVGKTLDAFAPLGTHLVAADQLNPDELRIECRVNDAIRQSSNTDDFILNTAQLVCHISRHVTVKADDIIFTGTPEGVILGYPKGPGTLAQSWRQNRLQGGGARGAEIRIALKLSWTDTPNQMYSDPKSFVNLFTFL